MNKSRITRAKSVTPDNLHTRNTTALDSNLDLGCKFFPTLPSEKPYNWEDEVDWSEGKPAVRNKIVINSTPPPLGEGYYPSKTKSQRCVDALSYTGALIGTFVEVLREAYLPEDQLAEIRRLSEEEGISTVIHMEWPPRLRS